MNQKRIFWMIVLFWLVSLDVTLAYRLEQEHGFRQQESQLLKEEEALSVLRTFALPKDAYEQGENLLAYLFCQSEDEAELKRWRRLERSADKKLYEDYKNIAESLLADAVYFPVPAAANDKKAFVSYENSWQSERTYGGVRGHEGTDIMASIQQRGYYPIVSVSDGVVEKIGWLPQGGYRIGIRSKHGVYYYYAHLAEYEEGLVQGAEVAAGQLLGYMGDTGYSEVEGTTGNFPVHLHFGMYLDLEGQGEVSFNPYYLLGLLEEHKLMYVYEKK